MERVRRYSFLITLGLTAFVGYLFIPSAEAGYAAGIRLSDIQDPNSYFRGVYNSAWVGGMVALTTTIFLSLFGFYLVKNAIARDRHTGVGEIIASTPLSKSLYILGKWLSNFAVLFVMIGTLAAAALVMQLVRGEVPQVELWALVSPFLLLALPVMVLTAALAVLFEAIPWLSGGLGNVVYFFLWIQTLADAIEADLFGLNLIEPRVTAAAKAAFPGCEFWASIGINPVVGGMQTFSWEGVQWTLELVLTRLVWVGLSFGIVLATALFSSRFDPAREGMAKRARKGAMLSVDSKTKVVTSTPARAHLTPLEVAPASFRFGRALPAELRLSLKGQPWWWYTVALGLVIASFFAPPDVLRRDLMPVAWIWPLLIWSEMGVREVRHRTYQLVFSAPHPLRYQLPVTWLAGVILTMSAGGGVVVRLILAGDWAVVLAWAAGALFIPSLALTLGVWSRSSKLFEVVYMTVWYLGPMSNLTTLDFMGAHSEAVAAGMPLHYLGLNILLLGLAVVGRRRQLQT
jgi:hypothetical protein